MKSKIYFVTYENEVKPFYEWNFEKNCPTVYDRDSENGLTDLTKYKERIDVTTDEFKAQQIEFFNKVKEYDETLYRYVIAISNEDIMFNEEDYDLELGLELEDFVQKLKTPFALFFREVYCFQKDICQFNEEWLLSYRGEYKNSDKIIIRSDETF